MKINLDKLQAHLQQPLLSVYFISGDEPLQIMEALDAIRQAAKKQGFSTREVLDVDTGFDWSSLDYASNSLSLFAEKKLIDLRIPTGKPGKDGGAALCSFAEKKLDDTVLLVSSGKLDKRSTNSKWYKAIDSVGAILTLWPIEHQQLHIWIQQRLQSKGMVVDREAISLLVERIEGNLLAAAQEIDKLELLYGQGKISLQQILDAVADSARYSIYSLADAALEGDAARAVKILNGLRGEGEEPILILWVLNREVRAISDTLHAISTGQSVGLAMKTANVWGSRQSSMRKALKRLGRPGLSSDLINRCGSLELTVKGLGSGQFHLWDELESLVMAIAGKPLPLIEKI